MIKSYHAATPPLITMATTPEEFFVEGHMEGPLASSSVFLDLPSTPDGNDEGPFSSNGVVPPYILHMLMEDDVDDKLLYRHFDNPALLQVQKPFAQILSSPLLPSAPTTTTQLT
uniref:Uncharacterized protein n=1 Tax=Arundo donax TaxID=35708 RepID=A0A0A9SJ49_ARUDO